MREGREVERLELCAHMYVCACVCLLGWRGMKGQEHNRERTIEVVLENE